MVYQGFFKILMITLISSKNLGGYKILRNTVPALTPPPVPVATVVPTAGPVKAKICKAKQIKCEYCFVQPIFHFLVTFGDKVKEIRKYYVIFVRMVDIVPIWHTISIQGLNCRCVTIITNAGSTVL